MYVCVQEPIRLKCDGLLSRRSAVAAIVFRTAGFELGRRWKAAIGVEMAGRFPPACNGGDDFAESCAGAPTSAGPWRRTAWGVEVDWVRRKAGFSSDAILRGWRELRRNLYNLVCAKDSKAYIMTECRTGVAVAAFWRGYVMGIMHR